MTSDPGITVITEGTLEEFVKVIFMSPLSFHALGWLAGPCFVQDSVMYGEATETQVLCPCN